jgi:hypothetical protein
MVAHILVTDSRHIATSPATAANRSTARIGRLPAIRAATGGLRPVTRRPHGRLCVQR